MHTEKREGGSPRIRHPRKDITPSSNQPPLSAQRATHLCNGPQLAMPFGFNTARENIDVPHWGSYNPCEGRVLEWRLRMYGMYHHPSWTFVCPPSLHKEHRQPALTLGNNIRWVSNKVQVKSENVIRRNGTGKYTMKALAFRPRSRTSP